MLTVKPATSHEFIEALALMKKYEDQVPIAGVSWDQEWAENNYQDKESSKRDEKKKIEDKAKELAALSK